MNLELILIMGIGAWLILAMFAKMSHALFSSISSLLFLFTLLFSIQTTTPWNLAYLISLFIIFLGAILPFFSSREYSYILAFILLVVLIFLSILNQKYLQDFIGAVIFLLLVLGLVKDLAYDKFFK